MASRLRFALSQISASTKLVCCQSRLQSAKHSTLVSCRRHQKQACNAVLPRVGSFLPTLSTVQPAPAFKPQHRNVQTEADKELSKFLEKEITIEMEAEPVSHQMGVDGFEVTTNDADVTLTRKDADETVVVKFSINIPMEQLDEADQPLELETARPPFRVEVSKADGRTLSLQCVFTVPDDVDSEEPHDAARIEDIFEILEVALHSGEWKDTLYSASTDVMDRNLYNHLMDMLDARGINDDFANQLAEFSTGYENACYINFLKGLKDFTDK